MGAMDLMLNTALKNFDFSKLLNTPQVQEGLALARSVVADFATIKNNQAEIIARLDRLEKANNYKSADLEPLIGGHEL